MESACGRLNASDDGVNAIAFRPEIASEKTGPAGRIQRSSVVGRADTDASDHPEDFLSALLAGMAEAAGTPRADAHATVWANPSLSSVAADPDKGSADAVLPDEVQDEDRDETDLWLGLSNTLIVAMDRPLSIGFGQVGNAASMDDASGAKDASEKEPAVRYRGSDVSDGSSTPAETGSDWAGNWAMGAAVPTMASQAAAAVEAAGAERVQEKPANPNAASDIVSPRQERSGLQLDASFDSVAKSDCRVAMPVVMTGRLTPRWVEGTSEPMSPHNPSTMEPPRPAAIEESQSLPAQTVVGTGAPQITAPAAGDEAQRIADEPASALPDDQKPIGGETGRPISGDGVEATGGSEGVRDHESSRDDSRRGGRESRGNLHDGPGDGMQREAAPAGSGILHGAGGSCPSRASTEPSAAAPEDRALTRSPVGGELPTEVQPSPLRAVQIQIDEAQGQSVNLRFVESGGEVRVSVRTQDTVLAAALNAGSPALENNLHAQGWSGGFHAGSESQESRGSGVQQLRTSGTSDTAAAPAVRGSQMGMGTGNGSGDTGRQHAASWAEQNEELMNTAALRRLSQRGVNR